MSIPIHQTIRCPKCGKDIEFTMWQTINDELPFAISDVISRKLFDIECKNCGHRDYVNYPILVNDMKHKVMIYYAYPDQTEEIEKTLESMRRFYDGRMRIVTDQPTLREKAAIFNAELDDRIIELLKAYVLVEAHDQLAGKKIQGMYFVTGDNPMFELVYDDGSGYIPIKMELYDAIEQVFSEREALEQDNELYVDIDWAWSFWRASEKQ